MDSLLTFLNTLDSFTNLQQAVLRSLETDKKKAGLISSVVGLSYNSLQLRYRNPFLWRMNELHQLAVYYQLPTRAYTQFYEHLPELVALMGSLPTTQRRQIERLCGIKISQLASRLEADWHLNEVNKLRQGLGQWVDSNY